MISQNIEKYIPKNVRAEIHGNAAVFEVGASVIQALANDLYRDKNLSLKIITTTDERKENGCFKIWYVFGVPKENLFIIPFIKLSGTEEFPSLAQAIHEAWNYERNIQTFFGLRPVGHPDQRPNILHENWPADIFPLRKDFNWKTRPEEARGTYKFQEVSGEGIYEIPVGPIHAGIIEPGHFRFSVAGEEIVLLEPRLGFTHKGSEKLFEQLPLDKKVHLAEKISGDSSFSHALAFCQAAEELSGVSVPERALYLRVVYAELERLANHLGDVGAIMIDTGFNFGGAHGARLRETAMRINEYLTGSRFLRGIAVVGGVIKDISDEKKDKLSGDLTDILKDFSEVVGIAENSSSLFNRLKGTGTLSQAAAKDRGVIGVAGKASGLANDARIDYPYAAYGALSFKEIATEQDGDVYARFQVRILEIRQSIKIIQKTLVQLPKGAVKDDAPVTDVAFKKNAISIGVVEGWRGDIVYFLTTDANGDISRVAVRDPSFVNWSALESAGFGNVVPDFPLINKSFNLSYSGYDL